MKTEPIAPAHIEFGDVPFSPLYGDAYHHPGRDALERARHVFLQGNDLPARWAGCRRFTILETGFGLGNNFLATWEAWRTDPRRCERLTFVSIERHPPLAADLAHAHAASSLPALAKQLIAAWPPLTPNLHVIEFEGGSVQLLLALGDVARLLPELRAEPNAFFLDGFAPASNPQMWQTRVLKALGRMAAPGATLATWNRAPELRAGLTSAGFEVDLAQGEMTRARHAPPFERLQRQTPAVIGDRAVVVGAGIAGASAALALSRAGLEVTVIDRESEPATATSGNPAGLFHGTIHADDGPHARLFRAAALVARNEYGEASRGLLRLGASLTAIQTLLREQGLPPDYVQALAAGEASALAGVPLPGPAWYYPGAGWLDAAAWVRQQLALPRVRWMGQNNVVRLARDAQGCWQLHDASDRLVASAPIVVLANAAGAAPLLMPMGHAPWPVTHSRGQVTMYRPEVAGVPRLSVAGDGYAIALDDGSLLCGATRDEDRPAEQGQSTELREADHHQNLSRLERLTGIVAPADPSLWSGRSGWRLQTADRLPIAGA
ncbi:MAG TPA: FAD-dependent 5-carboxymethylaminomethyl-2-thiouridine(34) oxidoreductase MnmC, partial [Rubrivivax sp.]|nr:FAD-dependent 5-carboxymethylaminomethyl-2-thiouridine(34) oxidoreductase MnmC [Rubrivivax sp.]